MLKFRNKKKKKNKMGLTNLAVHCKIVFRLPINKNSFFRSIFLPNVAAFVTLFIIRNSAISGTFSTSSASFVYKDWSACNDQHRLVGILKKKKKIFISHCPNISYLYPETFRLMGPNHLLKQAHLNPLSPNVLQK